MSRKKTDFFLVQGTSCYSQVMKEDTKGSREKKNTNSCHKIAFFNFNSRIKGKNLILRIVILCE